MSSVVKARPRSRHRSGVLRLWVVDAVLVVGVLGGGVVALTVLAVM